MKKALKTESITNELAGASAYFTRRTPPPNAKPAKADLSPSQTSKAQREPPAATPRQGADSRQAQTAIPVLPERPTSKQTSMKASTLASYPASIIEAIRKAVKQT